MIRTMFGCRSWAESDHAMTVMPDAASRSQWAVVCFFITSYVFFITPTPGPGNTVLTSIKPEIQTTSLGRRDKSTKNRSIRHVAAPEILPRASGFLPGLRFVLLLFPISALEISVAATENPVTATGFHRQSISAASCCWRSPEFAYLCSIISLQDAYHSYIKLCSKDEPS